MKFYSSCCDKLIKIVLVKFNLPKNCNYVTKSSGKYVCSKCKKECLIRRAENE